MPAIIESASNFWLWAGAVTETRRPVNPQPEYHLDGKWYWARTKTSLFACEAAITARHLPDLDEQAPYLPGDVVDVREPWLLFSREPDGRSRIKYIGGIISPPLAGNVPNMRYPDRWQSSRAMPGWAVRMQLSIKSARCIRLSLSLGPAAARVEGFSSLGEYLEHWDRANKKFPSQSDPWVWEYKFEVERKW